MKNFNESEFDPEKYAALLAEHLPGVINTPEAFERAEATMKALRSKAAAPEEERLAELLGLLAFDYRARRRIYLESVISTRNAVRQALEDLDRLAFLKVVPRDWQS